jgi:prefoldin alpha subunit
VDFIRTNLETLQDTIQKKQDNLNYLLSNIQSKLQAQTQGTGQA